MCLNAPPAKKKTVYLVTLPVTRSQPEPRGEPESAAASTKRDDSDRISSPWRMKIGSVEEVGLEGIQEVHTHELTNRERERDCG